MPKLELNREEMKRACQIASTEVLARAEQCKPDYPVIRDARGWICEQVYCGSQDDELLCAITLQWNYRSSGSVGRIVQVVHARLRRIVKADGRYLRLAGLHKAEWSKEAARPTCLRCKPGFSERHVIEADTSLEEY